MTEPADSRPHLEPRDRELLRVANLAADRAARAHGERPPASSRETWREKAPADFVTEVDLKAQRAVVETLRDAFPEHAVVAEEDDPEERAGAPDPDEAAPAAAPTAAPVRWIVDPLDGTTNWLHGYPEYAVSIAAEDDAGLRAAVVLNTAVGERFEAVRGAGAWRDGEPIGVSAVSDMTLALVGTGYPFKKIEVLEPYLDVFRRVLRETSGSRRGGSAALDFCDLACGRLDAFWELWLMPWDVAAGALILREAGGRMEAFREPSSGPDAPDPETVPFSRRPGAAYVAGNAALYEPFRELVFSSLAGAGPEPGAGGA